MTFLVIGCFDWKTGIFALIVCFDWKIGIFGFIISLKCSWYIIAILSGSRPENLQNSLENNCDVASFLTKLAIRLKRRFKPIKNTAFFKNTYGRLLWILSFFFKQFFTRNPEIIGTFLERFIFQIIGLFLLFMSGF